MGAAEKISTETQPAKEQPTLAFNRPLVAVVWLVTLMWSMGFLLASATVMNNPRFAPLAPEDFENSSFTSNMFVAAFMPVGMLLEGLSGDFSLLFCGVSFILGPIWAWIVRGDFSRALGYGLLFLIAALGSYITTRSFFNPAFMLGTLCAPVLAVIYFTAGMVKTVKEEVKRQTGLNDKLAEDIAKRKLGL